MSLMKQNINWLRNKPASNDLAPPNMEHSLKFGFLLQVKHKNDALFATSMTKDLHVDYRILQNNKFNPPCWRQPHT